ncbi:cysteine-rich protein 2-binding protein isoform X1 [Diorhabda carinulata]|uniref:cysteine-rich protein 2-binding protein isoform X1 n=1 Tax=Diorhabda carinulata TaxID=1163345 RepID=UPI0025A147B9|nr:cysteine-rich protein 2-binding protein isoform X1 [Diorhabda carinulata]
METLAETKFCKYCIDKLELCGEEGLECIICKKSVHLKCLKRGSVPGGLYGDIFFIFTCLECSENQSELFKRIRLSWLQVIVLVLYHLQHKSPGLARKGFFHWRHHVATFVDKNWEILFPSDFKKKKKWMGTIAGTLSHFNRYIFLSGISVFNEPAFWALMYPKITPFAISIVYSTMVTEKQNIKNQKKTPIPEAELFYNLLCSIVTESELLQNFNINNLLQSKQELKQEDVELTDLALEDTQKEVKLKQQNKRKILKSLGQSSRKLMKLATSSSPLMDDVTRFTLDLQDTSNSPNSDSIVEEKLPKENLKLLDPFCHYNTSLRNHSSIKRVSLQTKLTGVVREELILSPYSGIYLKPYIYTDSDAETFPAWLKLMAEIQIAANKHNKEYVLPPRGPIDYAYVQPEHIPAINSLCNQFFWPGIDLTEALQYPEFSCVALYKKLIIGFAFLVPDVKHTESYMSFLFTRPHWRNCGIAAFMIYHLIQTSLHKDITLHVAMDNPALLLYQKFGFKVENVVLNFYDKYLRSDVKESKHAFFCRLERDFL